ncbi:hypothetical protein ACXDGR_000152 [Klebsiella pneumoniae]
MPKNSYKNEKDIKSKTITVRVTNEQQEYINNIIDNGKAKTNAAAIQYLINKDIALYGGKI